METLKLGKAVMTPRGDYDPSKTYDMLDVVTYQGTAYVVRVNGVTNPPPEDGMTNDEYQVLSQRGEQGQKGETGDDNLGLTGVPTGGKINEVLTKNSDDDHDVSWKPIPDVTAEEIGAAASSHTHTIDDVDELANELTSIKTAINTKAAADHNHDTLYYRKAEINQKFEEAHDDMLKTLHCKVFSFKLDDVSESNPENMITYLADNVNFKPARMDMVNDVFDYGDWADAWFIKDLKVVMLNYDGTVAYEIDKNDYSKKIDGTASDYNNPDYPGNVMVAIPRVYWKIVENPDKTATFYVSNMQVDQDYHCWSHLDREGNVLDYCYIAAYEGSEAIDGRMRSLSGQKVHKLTNCTTDIQHATANNATGAYPGWYISVWCDQVLLMILTLLITKTTSSQTAIGNGVSTGWVNDATVNYNLIETGMTDKKGLFWGCADTRTSMKAFGIENLWGNIWRRTAGLVQTKGTAVKYKMTWGKSDGSTVEGYNDTGDGYLTVPDMTLPTIISGAYVKKMKFGPFGMVPEVTTGASSTTYYCDGFWTNPAYIGYVLCGGCLCNGAAVGLVSLTLDGPASYAGAGYGAALIWKG